MKSQFFRIVTLLVLSIAVVMHGQAKARDYINLSADIRKLPTAVPYFVNKQDGSSGELGRRLASLMSGSLEFHGFLTCIDPARYAGRQDANWNSLGAELAVVGQYEIHGDRLILEMRLFDVLNNQMMTGKRYQGSIDDQKLMVFKFCDEVIEKLTGEPGVALSLITFVSDGTGQKEIFLTDILGEQIRQVTKHKDLAVSPKFTADGRSLAYTSFHHDSPILYLTELSSKSTRAISWRPGLNLAPAFSPDGRNMVLTLSPDGNSDLYLLESDAQPRQEAKIIERLTQNGGLNVSPSWSPDGKKIAFVSDRGGSPQIYVMDVRSKQTKRITYQGNYNTSPSWSPKGDLIAYAGQAGGVYEIYTVSPEGGNPVQITKSWGSYESPSWSPDGRQIVFARNRNQKQEICVIFKNGSGLRTLCKLSGNQSLPQWSPRLTY